MEPQKNQPEVLPAGKKCQHKTEKLSYAAWHQDAEKRRIAGEKQEKCPVCNLWIWESNFINSNNTEINV